MVDTRDLLAATLQHNETGLRALLRPLDRVPETTPVSELLNTMRRARRHMILVSNEHGVTVGLVTLDDLLEELVGEIDDEFDAPTTTEEITHEPIFGRRCDADSEFASLDRAKHARPPGRSVLRKMHGGTHMRLERS